MRGGPYWEEFRSAQVPSQLAPRSIELGAIGPISLRRAVVIYIYCNVLLCVLDKPRVDYTSTGTP